MRCEDCGRRLTWIHDPDDGYPTLGCEECDEQPPLIFDWDDESPAVEDELPF
jgi:hypothetical protein